MTILLAAAGLDAGAAPAATIPAAVSPGEVRLPPVARHVLASGVTVELVRRPGLPLVAVELLLDVGAIHDPAGKEGLAAFTAELLRRGTQRRSADELDGAIEFLGGRLDTGAGADATTIGATLPSEYLDVALEIVAELAMAPAFPKAELDAQKRRNLAELQKVLDDPSGIADRVLLRALIPGHPYAAPGGGTSRTVSSFTRKDVTEFHARHFGPRRATLLIVGDIELDEALRLATARLGGWSGGTDVPPPPPLPTGPKKTKVLLVHKRESTQAQIRFVSLAFPRRTDPDYFPSVLANTVFGGGFTSRLMDEIRVNRGLSYGARTSFRQARHGGFLLFSSFTKNETIGELLKVALAEAEKLRAAGLTAAELERARRYVSGLYPLRLETNEQIAGALAERKLYGLPDGWVEQYRGKLEAVTLEQANATAKRWFFGGPLAIVLVGDEAAIRKGLAEAGLDAEIEVVTIEELG